MKRNILEIEHLHVHFPIHIGTVRAVEDVSLDLKEGEVMGLVGRRIGGAMISPKHANFIVNRGGASAADILALMDLVRKRVKEQTGIDLEPEIRVVS